MIQTVYRKEDGYDRDTVRTTGCSCCSRELDLEDDKAEIVKHALANVTVAAEVLALCGIELTFKVNTIIGRV